MTTPSPAAAYTLGNAVLSLLRGEFDDVVVPAANGSRLKCALLTSAYVMDLNDRYLSDLSGEVVHASYARQSLTGVTVTYDDQTGYTRLDCDDVVFPLLTANVRYVVFFREVYDAGAVLQPMASPLLVLWNLGADDVSAAANYTVTIDPTGLLEFEAV